MIYKTRWIEMKREYSVYVGVDDMLEKHLSQFQMLKLATVVVVVCSLFKFIIQTECTWFSWIAVSGTKRRKIK